MLLLVLVCVVVPFAGCLNVLIWNPTLSYSHVRFMNNIADILFERGHNVTVVSPILDPRLDNVRPTNAIPQIPFHSKYLDPTEWNFDIHSTSFWNAPPVGGRSLSADDLHRMNEKTYLMSKGFSEDREFVNRLRSFQFDVALHELYELSAVAALELIGVKKAIVVSAAGMTLHMKEITGVPSNPSFVPEIADTQIATLPQGLTIESLVSENTTFASNLDNIQAALLAGTRIFCPRGIPGLFTTYSDEMTFWERLDNFKFDIELNYFYLQWERKMWTVFNRASPKFPDLRELLRMKTGAILLNVNEFTETPRPTANIIRYVGGLGVPHPKPLNEKLREILDERGQNVLFSLGTIAQPENMPLWLKKDIVDAFAAFPNTTFIWKYEGDDVSHLLKAHPNVHLVKWAPQTDLLGDERLSLFITHAGMNSILEATFAGKPMITIPLFGDQFLNAKNLRRQGLAVLIERSNLNRETLIAALREVLSPNASYMHKASMVARCLHGRPAAARAEISRWVELVAEEGQMDHLLLRARDLSFIQYHSIDVMAYLLAQFVAALVFLLSVVRFLIRRTVTIFQKRKTD